MDTITTRTETTVQISAKERTQKKRKAEVRSKKKIQIDGKSQKNGDDNIKAGKIIEDQLLILVENHDQKTSKKRDEPYQDILSFLKTGKFCTLKVNVTRYLFRSYKIPSVCS